jgi:hypothetical protein
MTRRLLAGLLAGLWPALAGLSQAQDPSPERLGPPPAAAPENLPPACPAEGPPCCPTFEKTIHGVGVFLKEVQNATTVPVLTPREVVHRAKRPSLKLDWKEEKHTVTEVVMKPREEEQQVTCTKTEKCTEIDPCTGCPCTVFKEVPYVKTVKITVYDCVPVEKQIVVRVPVVTPVEEDIVIKSLAVDITHEAAICTTLQAITIPWQVTVQVPCGLPPLPPLPCPPPPCAPPISLESLQH